MKEVQINIEDLGITGLQVALPEAHDLEESIEELEPQGVMPFADANGRSILCTALDLVIPLVEKICTGNEGKIIVRIGCSIILGILRKIREDQCDNRARDN